MDQPKIYKAIAEVMRQTSAISKSRKNQQQGFQFRGVDDVMNELHGTLAECGVFVVPEVLEENRTEGKTKTGGVMFYTRLKTSFTFYAEDGSSVRSVVIGEAMDTGDKASNKALSIGFKYACLQVFCIPTEEDKDPDGQSHEFQPQAVQKKPAPAPKQKLPFEPKGGETTPEEAETIRMLLSATYEDKKPVFTSDELKAFSNSRKDLTAKELIAKIKSELDVRLGYGMPEVF